MKVFLGGEGPDDLGDWFHLPSYRTSPPRKGVVEALLARAAAAHAITVIGASAWKRIRKYQAKKPMPAEVRNVLGLALLAEEAGCNVLAPRMRAPFEHGSTEHHFFVPTQVSYGEPLPARTSIAPPRHVYEPPPNPTFGAVQSPRSSLAS